MSDSVDRVFVHALATVRRLPRTGSSRPPPTSRLRLYGLYKQSMEGDVSSILARPTLPISSPDLSSSVHRYASRDLRTREAQAEIEKWDAWHTCAGMSRTAAKREYISTLIATMKEYASGTVESRELVSELEFVWNQIKEQQNSDSSGSLRESPRLERGSEPAMIGQNFSESFESGKRQTRLKRTESGLRVLSPVSQRDEGSIVNAEDDEDDEDEQLDTAPSSPLANRGQRQRDGSEKQRRQQNQAQERPELGVDLTVWQRNLEAHLLALKTEIAALREQLSANHLLSSSTFSLGGAYYTLTTRQRIIHRVKLHFRHVAALVFRQMFVQLGILTLMMIWGRVQGDLRLEEWVKDFVKRFSKKIRGFLGGVTYYLLEIFRRGGRLPVIGRLLRIR